MTHIITSPPPPKDLPVLLRAWLYAMIGLIARLLPRSAYCARVAEHILRIAERTICDWIVQAAAARVRFRVIKGGRRPLARDRTPVRATMRKLSRMVRSRAPRRDTRARIVWLLDALADPSKHIARLLRLLRRFGRVVPAPVAFSPAALVAGEARRAPAPDP